MVQVAEGLKTTLVKTRCRASVFLNITLCLEIAHYPALPSLSPSKLPGHTNPTHNRNLYHR